MSISIDSNLLLSTYQNEQRQVDNKLGQDAFMKILMAELQNQDPMNPMQDKDFIAQLATFSQLEELTGMSDSLDSMNAIQQQNQLLSFSTFVGKEVKWHKIEESESGDMEILEGAGKITGIKFTGETVEFTLEDGTILLPENISELKSPQVGNSLVEASNLIGKSVTWLGENEEQLSSIVSSVSQKDGEIYIHTKDSQKIKASDLVTIE
ncbi:hypothetical protein Q75_06175 [Bacillus coahuilensis p1.1.43]|uniref:Basal-body rod modification protein FlgD n=1 Tax=Bacillus coahuilensis p1.1.43 TaxID=1150625 RepID=A0A147K9J9_9BACI|nr:flagellar hook capping FlgD N-terminal domain-containing protein [Bacillus coahuilensis]KUP07112.1 hypothetical protein Q75_06175 [Bacillus coahuilensis p1.1.43]